MNEKDLFPPSAEPAAAKSDGGHAFPLAGYEGENYHRDSIPGVTYRAWAAGMAIQGMLGSPHGCEGMNMVSRQNEQAQWAVQIADALIAALEAK